jgi:hypothetical protein
MKRGPKTKPDIICPRCGRTATPVRGYCKNCITTLVRTGQLPKIQIDDTPKTLTKYQEEILNGLMLGDGCLYRRKETHKPYLVVLRKQDDRDYLVENYEVFREFCKRGVIDGEVFDKRTGHTTFFSKFVTRRCGVFEQYYRKWYPNGEKCVPKDFILTPLTLAIWFCDDGMIRNSCSEWRFQLQLSTDDFLYKDVLWLKLELEKTCNEYFNIQGNEKDKSCRIGTADAGTRAFIKVIDDYLPKSMERKAVWRKDGARFYDDQPKRINPDVRKHGHAEFYRKID